jgi:hypothetical protein
MDCTGIGISTAKLPPLEAAIGEGGAFGTSNGKSDESSSAAKPGKPGTAWLQG